MAKTDSPFGAFDPSKFGGFDMTKFSGGFDPAKMFKDMKMPAMPGLDMEKLMALQTKNMEAVQEAQTLAADGMQAVARRHAEIMKSSMEQMSGAVKELMNGHAPEQAAGKQAEVAKSMLEGAVSNAKELSEMMTKAQQEAMEVLSKRFMANMQEIGQLFGKK